MRQVSGIGYIDRESGTGEESCENGVDHMRHHVADQLEREMDWVIEFHRMWNCRYVGLGAMPDHYHRTRGRICRICKDSQRIREGFE